MFSKLSGKRKMRSQVLILTSALSRWCQVKSDLLFAFEQTLRADLSEDLKNAIRSFLTRIRGGMSLEQALERFENVSSQEQFRDLISAVRVNVRHRGDLPALMESLELQFFKLEEAYQQRRISSLNDLRTTLFCFAAGLLIFTGRFTASSEVRRAFLASGPGLILMIIAGISYLIGAAYLIVIVRRINE